MPLIILEDSRQKSEKNAHIREQLNNLGCTVNRCKLYVGDYVLANNQAISIDTKQDMTEVEGNLTTQHKRFREECERASEAGIKLIILVVDNDIKRLEDVFAWKNPRRFYSKKCVTGRTLAKIMYSMRDKYGVEWEFCTKDKIGERILELLEVE